MSYKSLIWGNSVTFSRYYNLVRAQELLGAITVVGITSNNYYGNRILGYRFINKDEIDKIEFDIVIAMSLSSVIHIEDEIREKGFNGPVMACDLFALPGFSVEKYIEIKKNTPSVISSNCWGGLLLHRLHLPFLSPFINMNIREEQYLRLLANLGWYLDKPLLFQRMEYERNLKREYPVCRIEDVEINMNHYSDYDEAREAWNRRRKRIQWDNLLVMIWTGDRRTAEAFLALPYKRKVCFSPFDIKDSAACRVPITKPDPTPIWGFVNGTATEHFQLYDMLEMIKGNVIRTIED